MLDSELCYQAILTRDSRFDGVFFVAVTSTKIYCRPVCTVKTPMQKNCRFFGSAAHAEKEGFRPCLRCRPELAPGNAQVDIRSKLALQICTIIEAGKFESLEQLATECGCSTRHVRRVTEAEFGVSPIELATTHRLLLAKLLLKDTDMPITEIAFASGFSSVRRFNALLKERYRLKPTDIRKNQHPLKEDHAVVCELAYKAPLAFDELLAFLKDRAILGVESFSESTYRRTAQIGKYKGWFSVQKSDKKQTLTVSVSNSLAPVLPQILQRVKNLFDLSADPKSISKRLGSIAKKQPGMRVPGAFDGFELALRAILGQQITVKAASTLMSRVTAKFGEQINTPFKDLTYLTPSAGSIAGASIDDICLLGIISKRAQTLVRLAKIVHEGEISLQPNAKWQNEIEKLKELPGIGEWTAQYIAMRVYRWPDAFPHTDLGIYKALSEHNPKKVLAIAQEWQPWRAYATMHLWSSLKNQKQNLLESENEFAK